MIYADLLLEDAFMHRDPWPEVFKILRDRSGLTQKQVAKLVGSTQKTISKWENGKTRPKQEKKQEHRPRICR